MCVISNISGTKSEQIYLFNNSCVKKLDLSRQVCLSSIANKKVPKKPDTWVVIAVCTYVS